MMVGMETVGGRSVIRRKGALAELCDVLSTRRDRNHCFFGVLLVGTSTVVARRHAGAVGVVMGVLLFSYGKFYLEG